MRSIKVYTIISLFSITAAVLAIYSNTLDVPFVFDDLYSIVGNSKIRNLDNFWSWSTLSYPRPLVDFTFALNYYFGKLDVFGYHLFNIIVHFINGFLVYFLSWNIYRTLLPFEKSFLDEEGATVSDFKLFLMSLGSALVFVVHPLQTQAVTYIAQRYTSMAAMFYLLAILLYILARRLQMDPDILSKKKSGSDYLLSENLNNASLSLDRSKIRIKVILLFILAGFSAILAFLSKQNAVSLPGAVLLVEYILFDRSLIGWKKKLKWLVPILIICFIFVFYFLVLKGRVNFGNLLEDVSARTRDTEDVSRWEYLCTQFNVVVIYIRLLFVPLGQNLDYAYEFKQGFWEDWTPVAFLFLAGLLATAIWQKNRRPVISFAVFWFFLTLSVESSIIPIRDALIEHRLYLPMLGFSIFIAYLLFQIFARNKKTAFGLCTAIILTLGFAAHLRNEVWQSNLSLWKDVAAKSPENERAHYNLGNAWKRREKFDKAISEYNRAIDLKPDYAKARLNLGIVYHKKKRFQDAAEQFKQALEIKPDYLQARVNLGLSLIELGKLDQAVGQISKVLDKDPDNIDALYNLAVLKENKGESAQALEYYKKILKIKPNHEDALYNLANLQAKKGNLKKAVSNYKKALNQKDKEPKVHFNLANALLQLNRHEEAKKHYQRALRIKPDFFLGHYGLGNIYMRTGKPEKAVQHFKELIRINPDFVQAPYFLGIIRFRQGRLEKAKDYFAQTLDINPRFASGHVNLGLVLARQGKLEAARKHFLKTLKINPEHIQARKYLRILEQKLNETEFESY